MRSRLFCALAFAAALPSTAAHALSCEEFEARVQQADQLNLLRDFEMEPNPDAPQIVEVENLPDIMLGLSCPDARFEGLGASLTSGSEPARTRWAAFTISVMRALVPEAEGAGVPALAADLTTEANDDATRREVRDGLRFGRASRDVGDWTFAFETGANFVRIQIDPIGD